MASRKTLAQEFSEADLSPVFRANGTQMPASEQYATRWNVDSRTGACR